MKTASDILMDIVICQCPAIVLGTMSDCKKFELTLKAKALAEAEGKVLEAVEAFETPDLEADHLFFWNNMVRLRDAFRDLAKLREEMGLQ